MFAYVQHSTQELIVKYIKMLAQTIHVLMVVFAHQMETHTLVHVQQVTLEIIVKHIILVLIINVKMVLHHNQMETLALAHAHHFIQELIVKHT